MSPPEPLRNASPPLAVLLEAAPGANPTRRHWVVLALVWTACALLLVLFRPGFGFPSFRVLDSWIYSAYQWDLRGQIHDFGPTYYGSRLSWILPGALLHSALPLTTATLAYKLILSAVLAGAFALIVFRNAGFGAAIVATALSVLCPQIIVALHSDYVDTAVMVYGALAIAAITVAQDSPRWRGLVFLGGCFFCGMAIANLGALPSLGAGIAVYHLVWLRWSLRRQLTCIGLYAAAAVGVCLTVGLVHRWMGGDFFFLKPQFNMIDFMLENHLAKAKSWIPSDRWWFVQATWLVLPTACILWGLYRTLLSPPVDAGRRKLVQALTAGLAASFSIAALLQAREVNATLSVGYYASFYLSFALPLAAVCLAPSHWQSVDRRWLIGCLVALVAMILWWDSSAFSKRLYPFLHFLGRPGAVPLFAMCLLLAGTAIVVMVQRHLPQPARSLLRPELLLLGLVACSMPVDFHGPTLSDRLKERYVAVHEAYATLAREFPTGSYRFWVHPDNEEGVSLAATKLWEFRLLTPLRFPEIDVSLLPAEQTIVIPAPLGQGAEVLARANKILRSPLVTLSEERVLTIQSGAKIGFDLVCLKFERILIDPESGASKIKPLLELKADAQPPYPAGMYKVLAEPGRGEPVDYTAGYPVFTRTSPTDHLATDFVDLQPALPGESRELILVVKMPAAAHCFCMVQTKEAMTLAELTFTEAGRTVHTIPVPATAKNLRVYFKSTEASPTALPTRLTIYEIHAAAP
jgi:hypothetical protein